MFSGSTIEVIESETESFIDKVKRVLGIGGSKTETQEDIQEIEHEEVSVDNESFEEESKEFEEETKKTSFLDKILNMLFSKKEEAPFESGAIEESEQDFKRQIEALEAEEEKIEVEEQDLKRKKAKILHEILEKFMDHAEYARPSDNEELKEISKITVNVIKRLSKKEIEEFRNSYDFSRFKEILKDHNLLKDEGVSEEKADGGQGEGKEETNSEQSSETPQAKPEKSEDDLGNEEKSHKNE
jgi:hypothetical protein